MAASGRMVAKAEREQGKHLQSDQWRERTCTCTSYFVALTCIWHTSLLRQNYPYFSLSPLCGTSNKWYMPSVSLSPTESPAPALMPSSLSRFMRPSLSQWSRTALSHPSQQSPQGHNQCLVRLSLHRVRWLACLHAHALLARHFFAVTCSNSGLFHLMFIIVEAALQFVLSPKNT